MQGNGVIVVQFLHVFFGAILVGSSVFMNFVLIPVLLKRPSAESRAFFETGMKPISILMGVSGGMTLLLGVFRGTLFGQIKSLPDLSTPYGITFLIAFALTLMMMILGPRTGPLLLKKTWNGKKYNPNAAKEAAAIVRFPLIMTLIILICMVLMHFGF